MNDNVSWIGARPNTLQTAEHFVTTWHVTVSPDMPFDEVLKPDYWTNVARKMRPHQRVIVDCEDGSYTATLFVRSAQRLSAHVEVISKSEFGKADTGPVDGKSGFEIKWAGPSHKHRIIRKSDNEVIQHGFETPEAADAWLGNYVKNAA